VTTISYILFALLSGAETIRDATGPVLVNGTIDEVATNLSRMDWSFASNCSDGANYCKWGSQNSFQVKNTWIETG